MTDSSVEIPGQFVRDTIAREGADGEAWLAALPNRVSSLLARWRLTQDGSVMHGYLGVVVPVRRDGERFALKVTWIDQYNAHEIDALEAWQGCGAVSLISSDRSEGALLLERLDANRTLESISSAGAAEVAATLLRRLAIPAPPWARPLEEEAAAMAVALPADWARLGRPFGSAVVERALSVLDELRSSLRDELVNTDLHYGNVLAAQREPWLAIDPKVVRGDLEYGVAPLLWSPHAQLASRRGLKERLALVVSAGDLDAERARGWTYVRVIEYWLWALEAGLTKDPAKCEVLAEWL